MAVPLEVLYPNGRTEAVQMFIWSGGQPVLWDGSVTFSGSLPSTVAGNLTNNNAAPAANNLGVLPAVATTAAPTWSEGKQVLLSTDLAGNLRVLATIDTSAIATSANQTNGNQKTKIVDGSGNVIGSTSNALDVNIKSGNPTTIAVTNAGTFAVQESQKITPYFYLSSGTTNQDSQIIKNSAGTVNYISVFSTVAAARYVKLYDKATGPTSSDTPVYVAAIPNNTTGAGSNIPIPLRGINFTTGIGHRITTGAANNDTGAASTNDVVVNIGYA